MNFKKPKKEVNKRKVKIFFYYIEKSTGQQKIIHSAMANKKNLSKIQLKE